MSDDECGMHLQETKNGKQQGLLQVIRATIDCRSLALALSHQTLQLSPWISLQRNHTTFFVVVVVHTLSKRMEKCLFVGCV